jgi:ParB/RepB/Spo0J family partition protein
MTAPATVPRETRTPVPRPVSSLDDVLLELVDIGDNVRDDVGDLTELTASIAELGLLSPVKVTAQADGRYRLVYGQRRVLACRALGRLRISAIVEPTSDVDAEGPRRSIEQLVENLQREDLNPIEEAVALREVLDGDPSLTQEALADMLAMSRPWVSNTLGLLEAAPAVQKAIRDGALTASHAKALRGLSPKIQADFAEQAIERGYSAHEVEQSVQRWKEAEDWQRKRANETAKENRERTEGLVASLEKKGVAKEARIHVAGWGNGNTVKAAAAALAKAGFTNVRENREGVGSKSDTLGCTCSAWLIEVGYGSPSVRPACVVQAHRDAKMKAERDEREQKYALQGRVQSRLAEVLVDEVASLGPQAARVTLWIVLSWGIDDWTKKQDALLINALDPSKPKRKKRDPWATLTETSDADVRSALAKALAEHLRDGNYKVGWAQLAAELGVLEEPPAPAKKGRKAPA